MKQYPKEKKYLFFASVTLIQQATKEELSQPKNINVILATRTIEKVEKEFSFTTSEGIYTHF